MTRLAQLLTLAAVLTASTGLAAQGRQPDVVPPRLNAIDQERGRPSGDDVQAGLQQTAEETRRQLQTLLYRLPPNLRTVLQADPSLIERADYLAPYPDLVEFLKQHPEVARNPIFFIGWVSAPGGLEPLEVFAGVLAGLGLFIAFITLLVIVATIGKQVVDYRRWVRQTRLQSEVHTKILDRLQSNEDLLAYMQTPAGRHFLEFTPLESDPRPRMWGAPFGRILWSVQAGVVLAALGVGLRFAQGSVPEEIIPAFNVLGIIVLALGAGAVVSAVVAYFLSARFGLIPLRRQES